MGKNTIKTSLHFPAPTREYPPTPVNVKSAYIPLTKGETAIVDQSMYELLSEYRWHYDGRYARTYINGKPIRMHKLITGYDMTDHINQNCLDNRTCNLREADKSLNMHNRGRQSNNISGYKGVHQRKDTKRFQSYIKLDGVRYHFGYYKTAIEAASVYDQVAMQLVGKEMELNLW